MADLGTHVGPPAATPVLPAAGTAAHQVMAAQAVVAAAPPAVGSTHLALDDDQLWITIPSIAVGAVSPTPTRTTGQLWPPG